MRTEKLFRLLDLAGVIEVVRMRRWCTLLTFLYAIYDISDGKFLTRH